jgi:hypothetical protein
MFELFPSIVCLGGIREDFDEYHRVQQNFATIGFKLRFAAHYRQIRVSVQARRFNAKLQVARIDSAGLFLELLAKCLNAISDNQVVIG